MKRKSGPNSQSRTQLAADLVEQEGVLISVAARAFSVSYSSVWDALYRRRKAFTGTHCPHCGELLQNPTEGQ